MYEFHVSRLAREKYDFDQSLFRFDGNVIFTDFLAARRLAHKINQERDLVNFPEQAVKSCDINAIGLIDEILHLVISLYRQRIDPKVFQDAYDHLEVTFGEKKIRKTLIRFIEEFPPLALYRDGIEVDDYLDSKTNGISNKIITLEELLMLWTTNRNPAVTSFDELFDDTRMTQMTIYRQMVESLRTFFEDKPTFGPDNQDLITMLRSPAIAEPHSLTGQLEYIRRKWGSLIGDYLYRLLNSLDLIREETRVAVMGAGPSKVPTYQAVEDEENFSPDSDWMPRTVMIAKNTYVWLYQLSKNYGHEIKHLDQIPDEELDKLSSWGFTGLWLIGLWERSEASKRIKQLCGNPEAVASAYSLKNYVIANDLGGDEAFQKLRDKAWQRGIRLASDMVPNHMGIDSKWVIEHPDWFISSAHSPFPSYSFNGPDLSPVDDVGIFIEDGYYHRTDAAVVFKRVNKHNGETRYVYHGNDGTSMPWNDTAQLNYLKEEVREEVIQTILHVARKFPIIRFDAAMTLAKKHYQRLWFPQPGTGGAIPSRAEQGLTKDEFDRVFPKEFWREVVDRVSQDVPDTLLLAEAFWLMEVFFVRTLGMHRVYNSAFMNMLRNEENAKYRLVIKNTLEFDPQILKRYVNFMNNPDEKTAVDQFGKGDKYFGICALMATMPGLPMFGHGQIQGFAEKYGMEYYRPYWDEEPDMYLIQRHQEEIFPLLKRRELFAGVSQFLLYGFCIGEGRVDENVFAYSNGSKHERALVLYHNHFGSTQGWLRTSASFLNKKTGKIEKRDLYEGLGIMGGANHYVIFRDSLTNLQYIRRSQDIQHKGLYFHLDAYECHVFMDFREVEENELGQYAQLTNYLNGRGVHSIEEAMREFILAPVLNPLRALIDPETIKALYQNRLKHEGDRIDVDLLIMHGERFHYFLKSVMDYVNVDTQIEPIVKEEQRGLEAILKLPIFQEHYPYPSSKKYHQTLEYIQKNVDDYPFIWSILLCWNDLRLMGKVITDSPQFAEISRCWVEEWGILRVVEKTLLSLGMEDGQARNGGTIIKLLTNHQNWVDGISEQTPLGLMEGWFASDEVRQFLNVNRYHDKLWFKKEAFESMMWWMMTTALVYLVAEPEKSFAEDIEILIEAFGTIQKILAVKEESEYQVDKLLKRLK
jgi:glycosidase